MRLKWLKSITQLTLVTHRSNERIMRNHRLPSRIQTFVAKQIAQLLHARKQSMFKAGKTFLPSLKPTRTTSIRWSWIEQRSDMQPIPRKTWWQCTAQSTISRERSSAESWPTNLPNCIKACRNLVMTNRRLTPNKQLQVNSLVYSGKMRAKRCLLPRIMVQLNFRRRH